MRIFSKLTILSLCLAIFPLILVVSIFLYSAQGELTKEIYGRLSAVSSLKKDRLETFFVSRKEDLKAVQGFLDVQMHLPTLQQFDRDRYNFAYLKAVGQLNDQLLAFMNSYHYADIMLLSTKGKTVFVANRKHVQENLDKIAFSELDLQKAKTDIYISDPIETHDEDSPYVVYILSAAYDIQKQFSGYIVLVVDMRMVYDFIENNTGVGTTSETFLVKKMPQDKFLFISPLRHDSKAILNKTMPALMEKGISESFDYRGEKVLSVMQNISFLDWGLITKIDKKEVFFPVFSMRNLCISIFVIVLLIIIFSSFVFAESISDPIHQLQEGTIIIGHGNLDYKVGKSTKDEIGYLSRAFDEMVDNLKNSMASRQELEQEIVKRKQAEEQLKELAQDLHAMSVHDPLTGVLNRRGLQDVLGKTIAMSQRMGINVQVMLLDLDNFKQINDGHGYGAGDKALETFAQKIVQTVRQTDHIARVGGDEFIVLFLDAREAEVVMVADKIRMAVAQSSTIGPSAEAIKITCSIGIIPLGDGPMSIDGLLQKLHLSMRASKGHGKNRVAYQGDCGQVELKNSDETSELKQTLIEGKKFYAAAQPIFNLRDKSITSYEILSRLNYQGYSSPDEFFLFALNANLLGLVDYACFKTSLNSLKNSSVSKRVHMNIFPSTLAEIPAERLLQDFIATGKNISFCLEINEQQILGDPSYLIPSIRKLKSAGVVIALDDYGFGRSSVETLILLEPDIVKIDKKIIKDVALDARKQESLRRLLRVIESCKASVIAEGIETDQDLQLLLSLGVISGQGFLMGRPESPPNFV